MSVTFKKVLRKDPFHKDGTGKYYPQLIVWGKSATLESIAVQMKESSSLTLGDIQSVITNFVASGYALVVAELSKYASISSSLF